MSRWPLIVGVVTSVPAGRRFDPREVNVAVAPGDRSRPWRSPRNASIDTIAAIAASDGGARLWSPMKEQSWAKPWLPPVASAAFAVANEPVRPS